MLLESLLSGDGSGLWQRLEDHHYALTQRLMLQASIDRGVASVAAITTTSRVSSASLALNDFYLRPAQEEATPTCRWRWRSIAKWWGNTKATA